MNDILKRIKNAVTSRGPLSGSKEERKASIEESKRYKQMIKEENAKRIAKEKFDKKCQVGEHLLKLYGNTRCVTYAQRSLTPHYFKSRVCESSDWFECTIEEKEYFTHKVTVVGIVYKVNDSYSMDIAWSIWNPKDNYSRQLGYQEALLNLGSAKKSITIEGLPSEFNKDLFLNIANQYISEKEYMYPKNA